MFIKYSCNHLKVQIVTTYYFGTLDQTRKKTEWSMEKTSRLNIKICDTVNCRKVGH